MESLHYLLMKTQAMFQKKILAKFADIGLTPGQPKVLEFLFAHGEADQKTIANYCEIEQATVGSILTRMENCGLIVRRQKQGNRRSLYVSLTEKGNDAARKVSEIFKDAENSATAGLSAAETEKLKSTLAEICAALNEKNERRQNQIESRNN